MVKESKTLLISSLIIFITILLQSTLLEFVKISNIKPDLSLIVIIFIAVHSGIMVGQVSGFFCGILQGFIGGPFSYGFHALAKTLLGFFFGITRGTISVDPIFMPSILVIAGTIIKTILHGLIHLIFLIPFPEYYFRGVGVEIIYNAILAPFIFAILKLFNVFKIKESEIF